LNFEIGFQALEKVLNLAKIYISIEKVWKLQMEKKSEVSEHYFSEGLQCYAMRKIKLMFKNCVK